MVTPSVSNRRERPRNLSRKRDANRVTGPYVAARHDDTHDTSLADEPALRVTRQCRRHQAPLHPVQLSAGVAQAGHLDHGRFTQVQSGTGRQPEEIDATRGDVLAHLPCRHDETRGTQLVVQLSVEQVHLPQVGLARIPRHARAMLDRMPHVRVALDTQPGQKPNAFPIRLAHRVCRAAAHRSHDPALRSATLHRW